MAAHHKNRSKISPQIHRSENSFSLVYVAGIGAAALMTGLAISAALMPTYRNVASLLYINEATSAAENSVQYALARLNEASETGSADSFSSNVSVPDTVKGAASVSVSVSKIDTTFSDTLTNSPIFNPNMLNLRNDTNFSELPNDYRLIQATAKYNSFTRTVFAIVGPSPPFGPAQPSKQATPLFKNAAYANSSLSLKGGVGVSSEGNSGITDSSIGSNKLVRIDGASSIEGNVYASNSDTSKIALSASQDAKVLGNIFTPSNQIENNNPPSEDPNASAFTPDDPFSGADPSKYNLFGDGQAPPSSSVVGSFQPSQTSTIPPANVANSTQPAQLNQTGGLDYEVISPSTQSDIADLGSLQINPGQTVTLNPGTYIVNSIDIANGGTLSINVPSSSSNGVQIYVQGSGAGTSAITISGSMTPTSASNFQIFYNGTKNINIAMTSNDLYGLIYAPSSTITVNTGSSGRFHGAFVGDSISLSGSGKILFDKSSVNPGSGSPGVAPGPGYYLDPQSIKYRILSWHEK